MKPTLNPAHRHKGNINLYKTHKKPEVACDDRQRRLHKRCQQGNLLGFQFFLQGFRAWGLGLRVWG